MPSLTRRILLHLNPFRGKRLREAEKDYFWQRLEGLAGEVRMLGYQLKERQREQARDVERLEKQARDVERLEKQARDVERLEKSIERLEQMLAVRDRVITRLQGDLQFQRRRLTRLDRDACVSRDALQATTRPDDQAGHDIYLAFEERFRGPVTEIKERLRPHLGRVQAHPTLSAGLPLLDIGCGRGEWLELLAECGIEAYGVDTNPHVVTACTVRGLAVRAAEGLDHLTRLPDGALGAITAFHVIEHLSLDVLLHLLEQARRVLVPGGLLLLETPNPENIKVGATTFHYDPTHNRPIPPQLAEFLVESRGFADIEVLRLNPYPESSLVKEPTETAFRLNELMFGPQDYAILARKA